MADDLVIDFPPTTNIADHLNWRFGFDQEPEEDFWRLCCAGVEAFTYFALGDWTGRVKVGMSKDPWRRMGELPSATNGEQATLIAVLRGSHFEPAYHRLWAQDAVGNEWFAGSHEVYTELAWLERLSPPIDPRCRTRSGHRS